MDDYPTVTAKVISCEMSIRTLECKTYMFRLQTIYVLKTKHIWFEEGCFLFGSSYTLFIFHPDILVFNWSESVKDDGKELATYGG